MRNYLFVLCVFICSCSQPVEVEKSLPVPKYISVLREMIAANPDARFNDIKKNKFNAAMTDSLPVWFNKGYFDSAKYSVRGTKLLKNGTSAVHLSFIEPDSIEPFEKIYGDFIVLVRGDTGTYFLNGTAYYLNLHRVHPLDMSVLNNFSGLMIYSPFIGISPFSTRNELEFGFGVHMATLKTPISKPTQ
jgi:hypothetical protein